jgi:hypothetical protein
MYYEFRILLARSGNLPPEEVRQRFFAMTEGRARKLAEEWAGPGAIVGECCGRIGRS